MNGENTHINVVFSENNGQTNENAALKCEDKNVCCRGRAVEGRLVQAKFGCAFFFCEKVLKHYKKCLFVEIMMN